MKKQFIITGTHNEFNFFVKKKLNQLPISVYDRKDFIYVPGPETFFGHEEVGGWFYGSWRERKDIREILDIISVKAKMPYMFTLKNIFIEYGLYP
jgi:hypothetical protein